MTIVSELDRALAGLRGTGGKQRGTTRKRCRTCGGATRPWAGLDWCPRCMSAVAVDTKRAGGKRRQAAKGPRGGRTEIQSLLFPRKVWNEDGARIWAGTHGFRDSNADVTGKYIRLRQAAPGKFRRMRTKILSRKPQVKAIIGVR